ncbi:MAG: DUF4173 domain-containing protein [Candidatus Limnocylindrales bacterium]
MLIAVDVLFAIFVVLQVAYLFGGIATVSSFGITYSSYAREGYFQLVGAVAGAGLLLAVVAAAAGRARGFVGAALGLVGLTAVILASAAVRLDLYQRIYGWTELRFYVAASIAWLGLGLAIAVVLLVRGRMHGLFHGLAFAAIIVTLVVTAIGPQAFITRINLARALDPRLVPTEGETGFDPAYVASLGDDAIPALVDALPRLDVESRATLLAVLRMRKAALADDPSILAWPSWNLAREQARRALQNLP